MRPSSVRVFVERSMRSTRPASWLPEGWIAPEDALAPDPVLGVPELAEVELPAAPVPVEVEVSVEEPLVAGELPVVEELEPIEPWCVPVVFPVLELPMLEPPLLPCASAWPVASARIPAASATQPP